MRKLDYPVAEGVILDFIRSHVLGKAGIVLGISGGVDSALTAALAVRAIGADRVVGVYMPYFDTADRKDARLVARHLGITLREISIRPVVDAFLQEIPETLDKVARGNVMARTRMMLLYAIANQEERIVVGTGNRSEWLTGYFTKWGDGACDIAPIVGLYKTEVWEMARRLEVPERIVAKPPTAGLWIGQTDEGELGVSYAQLDTVLHLLFDQHQSIVEVAQQLAIPVEQVAAIDKRVRKSAHKRQPPVGPQLYGTTESEGER